jgi:cytochrome P450
MAVTTDGVALRGGSVGAVSEVTKSRDWATEFDHTDPEWAARAPEIWDELRARCPVAHSDRFGGVWLPTRHDDVVAIAHDTENYTSQGVVVSDMRPDIPAPMGPAPPITSDPPFHHEARRLLLPPFSPKAIAQWEVPARESCRALLADLPVGDGVVDAAEHYAQHVPVRVIAEMLGVPAEDGDLFRTFIHRILEDPGAHDQLPYEETIDYYLDQVIDEHHREPRDDLIGYLIDLRLGDQPLLPEHVRGTVALLLIAGIDTTWSAIGASLWHLAQHPEDRRRLVDEPDLVPTAVEEFLRAYAPVTMARLVARDHDLGGCRLGAGDWVLLPFPAANRDPGAFEDAGEVIIDRAHNRHAAFGLGIHRCLGSNLARMEMTVAIEEWLAHVPDFELADPGAVRWSTGQVRGPRSLPLRVT